MLAGGVGYGTQRDCLKGSPEAGNKVVVMGGDNYRIGLGGGSVSSVETGRYSSGIELNAVQRANAEMQKRAKEKADMLYAEIDRNKMFRGTVTDKADRSYMNICFVMNDEYKDLEADFLKFATEKGMVGIKGHRSVGGFRASCYNAMPKESVQALIDCMQEFEKLH